MNSQQPEAITLGRTEAGLLMAALDYALCNQPSLSTEARAELRPIVDKMSSTFGFKTERLDKLIDGHHVEAFPSAFETKAMENADNKWFRRLMGGD